MNKWRRDIVLNSTLPFGGGIPPFVLAKLPRKRIKD